MAFTFTGSLIVLSILFGTSSLVHGAVVKVCRGTLSFASCSNCCSLSKGCIYLQPGTGLPTCVGGETRACPRNCEGPKLQVCPANATSGLAEVHIEVVRGKLPPSGEGCNYYNIFNGDYVPKVHEASFGVPVEHAKKEKCKLDSLVEVCNGVVSAKNCGCCPGPEGCLFLENVYGNRTCIPGGGIICTKICRPTVSVCSSSVGLKGTTLDSCRNTRRSCDSMPDGCSLYDRGTGEDYCTIKQVV